MKYLYLGNIDIHEENVKLWLRVAKCIKCPGLIETCESFIITSLNTQNVQIYSDHAEEFTLTRLKFICSKFMLERFVEISHTTWFKSMSSEKLSILLEHDNLHVESEDDVVEAVDTWLKDKPTADQQEYATKLMPLVRLKHCSRKKLEVLSTENNIVTSVKASVCRYLANGCDDEDAEKRVNLRIRFCY